MDPLVWNGSAQQIEFTIRSAVIELENLLEVEKTNMNYS